MSSGVIVNGGTAESFAAEDGNCHVNYSPWEPEDLVATVQFLATLDERQMLPYVLPDDNRDSVVIVSKAEQDPLLGSVSDRSDPFNDFSLQVHSPLTTLPGSECDANEDHVNLDLVSESEPLIQRRPPSPTESWLNDDHENMEVSASVSFTEDDNRQPVFGESHQHCYLTDTVATPSSESFISGSLTIRDVTDETSSAAQTPCSTEERSIIRASNKPAHLKRVSFGNSKGSMVETLVYESPLTEEEPSPFGWKNSKMKNFRTCLTSTPVPEETTPISSEPGRSASKVRVTFFESERPLILTSPEASDVEWEDNMAEPPPQQQPQHAAYVRQISTESGQDNPFRPDGDLSREADELVELIKGGRPISEALKGKEEPQQQALKVNEVDAAAERDDKSTSSPGTETDGVIKSGANGNAPLEPEATRTPATNLVEVQHGVVVPAADGSQVEHVVIKKKGKCQCCVIQ